MQVTGWQKIFIASTGKGSLPRIYKELLQVHFLKDKRANTTAGEGEEQAVHRRGKTVNEHVKKLQPRCYQTQIFEA